MKKAFFLSLALALLSTGLTGCRAEAEIDPDGKVSYNQAAPY